MPLIIQYLLKLSLSLALVYLFYQLLLRKWTFYNCNRFYLLGYTILCFIIPFINITPALKSSSWEKSNITSIIPAWQLTNTNDVMRDPVVPLTSASNYWNILLYAFIAGSIVLAALFCVRYLSFLRIRRGARMLAEGNMKIYQVDKNIMPFSFGNEIFINHTLHGEEELREIIRHEFVHVRQKHSIDILWAELLCMLNWYNPFVWLIRKSIRQNLEFIADEQVVNSGLDKKQYQYMLLKVIGNNHFSIANQFNFSSLKKRIAMMNKNETSKRQLLRLVLLLPAIAVLLLAFRQQSISKDTIPGKPQRLAASAVKDRSAERSVAADHSVDETDAAGLPAAADLSSAADAPVADTTPFVNDKGYNISVKNNKGNCLVVVSDRKGSEVKKVLLTDWNKNREHYEELYGEVPPPPPPPAIEPPPPPPPSAFSSNKIPPPPPPARNAAPAPAGAPENVALPIPPPPPPKAPKLPANVSSLNMNNGQATVVLKDGRKETYNLNNDSEKAVFEKKYGKLPEAPEPPPVQQPSAAKEITRRQTPSERDFISRHSKIQRIEWGRVEQVSITPSFASARSPLLNKGDIYIQIYFKNGSWDMYNTSKKEDVERFKKNYGEAPPSSPFGDGC